METLALPAELEMWQMIAAVLLPLLLSVVMKQTWSSTAKSIVSLAACVVIATADAFFAGNLTLEALGKDILVVFFIVFTTYKGFWLPTGIAPRIEKNINK